MDKPILFKSLEKAVYIAKGTRLEKLRTAPIKFVNSKLLELIAMSLNKTFKIKTMTFWNENMFVIIPEEVSLFIFRYGFYEEGLTRMVLEYLKPGMTFFDIGAHFGYFSLLALYIVGDKGYVHSFEPTPSTFSILRSNTFKKPKVILNNLAVASKRKTVVINDYGIRFSAFNSVFNARLPNNIISKLKPQKHEIPAISIDEYVEENKVKPDFIKIDAESFEYEILLGMEETINKISPIISLEVGDYGVKETCTSKKLIEFLNNKGYKPYEYKEGNILPHNVKEVYQYDNILFLPR